MGRTLLDKVWDTHAVRELPNGQTQLFIGLHLVHEVTSPQAFQMLAERGLSVRYPHRTFATVDHIIPTTRVERPYADGMAEQMFVAIERNLEGTGIALFDRSSSRQGIVHVIGPELGLTQPGMTIACGDSHTSTHGAFGSIALGIGTSQVRDVLATQTLAVAKPRCRRIVVDGELADGVYAKDVILDIIGRLGVQGGVGYAYEYAGSTFERMSMDERMTVCNMSIEGGARVGYVNPDATTYAYVIGREYAPAGADYAKATSWWDTNSRLSDLREAARVVEGRQVSDRVMALVVPGSQQVQAAAEAEGLADVFRASGFEWREAGCSMCLAMNPDKLVGDQVCASSSNRNFKGRQGSPTGRTLLMSPAMVAAAALAGEVTDVRALVQT